MYTGLAC